MTPSPVFLFQIADWQLGPLYLAFFDLSQAHQNVKVCLLDSRDQDLVRGKSGAVAAEGAKHPSAKLSSLFAREISIDPLRCFPACELVCYELPVTASVTPSEQCQVLDAVGYFAEVRSALKKQERTLPYPAAWTLEDAWEFNSDHDGPALYPWHLIAWTDYPLLDTFSIVHDASLQIAPHKPNERSLTKKDLLADCVLSLAEDDRMKPGSYLLHVARAVRKGKIRLSDAHVDVVAGGMETLFRGMLPSETIVAGLEAAPRRSPSISTTTYEVNVDGLTTVQLKSICSELALPAAGADTREIASLIRDCSDADVSKVLGKIIGRPNGFGRNPQRFIIKPRERTPGGRLRASGFFHFETFDDLEYGVAAFDRHAYVEYYSRDSWNIDDKSYTAEIDLDFELAADCLGVDDSFIAIAAIAEKGFVDLVGLGPTLRYHAGGILIEHVSNN